MNTFRIVLYLPMFILLAVGCNSPQQELKGPEWADEYRRAQTRYFSRSMVEAMSHLDSTGIIGDSFTGIHDVFQFTLESDMLDSTNENASIKIMEDIEAMELESILPPILERATQIKAMGKSVDGDIKYVIIAIHQDPEITVFELRGTHLKETLIKAMMSAFMSENPSSIPFMP